MNEVLLVFFGLLVGAAVGAGVTFWALRRSLAVPDTEPPIAVAGAETVEPVEPVHEVTNAEEGRGVSEALDASDRVLTELEKRYRGRKADRDKS
ncbi:MAG TPA: hypothetical protein VIO84_06110 [Candidatus Dormibacteraeota bacterium]